MNKQDENKQEILDMVAKVFDEAEGGFIVTCSSFDKLGCLHSTSTRFWGVNTHDQVDSYIDASLDCINGAGIKYIDDGAVLQ